MKRAAIICLAGSLVMGLSACSEPLVFPEWTISVPEGTRIVEHAAIPDEERTARIALERHLVLGGDTGDPNAVFFRPRDVATDAEGRIYVLDQGNHRVQVFAQEGRFLRTIGRQGQGPGELQYPVALAVRDDRLVVADSRNARLGIWDLTGAHIADVSVDRSKLATQRLAALADASILVAYRQMQSLTEATGRVSRIWWEEEDERSFVEVRSQVRIPFRESRGSDGIQIVRPEPSFAAAPSGDLYVTGADEYQVVALAGTGEPRWALRVAHEKTRFSEEYIESYIEQLREGDPGVTVAHLEPDRPDFFPALERILVDGRGRLYVVPYEEPSWGAPRDQVPVDIYSPTGERVFAGWMPNKEWRAAHDDFVHVIETDPDSGEDLVVRYRLVLPYE